MFYNISETSSYFTLNIYNIMNGLALRISPGGDGKSKKSISFSVVNIPVSCFVNLGEHHELFKGFVDAASTDEQLSILKKIMNTHKEVIDTDVIKFMAVLFLQTDAKHPVKCLISRHVTKNSNLHNPFSDALSSQILAKISTVPTDYKQYIEVISKVATCVENFNAGVHAVRLVETELAVYLKDCLVCCVDLLDRDSKKLSPTEKNEIFNLSHLSLRLLLHIIQKASEDSLKQLIPLFNELTFCAQELMSDNDVPMDTKSVCGILHLSMYLIEKGPHSWIDILTPSSCSQPLQKLLEKEAGQLCFCSALATVVSVEQLEATYVEGNAAILTLLFKILEIGDRSSLESTVILGVARTVFQMSKYLEKMKVREMGLKMVDSLLTFAWSHLEHYMDSVRHVTAQMLATVVTYCAKLDREGDDRALMKLLTALKSLDTSRRSYYVSVTCIVNELGSRRVLTSWPTLVQDLLVALSSQHIQASVTAALGSLISSHAAWCSPSELARQFLQPVMEYVCRGSPDCTSLHVLEDALVTAVKLNHQLLDYIIPYIKQFNNSTSEPEQLKCVLMLLSVTRKSGISDKLPHSHREDQWKGVISYEVLRQAAIDAIDETRILSLSLIVESPKSTEQFSTGDLAFVLWYLQYNINAQAPNFRQLTLSCLKKFMKRLEESYKVIKRQSRPNADDNKVGSYLQFVEKLRELCFDSLLPRTNYSRRCVALQLLVWTHRLRLDGYTETWTPDHVEQLLLHLEDSYENNKALALEVLDGCPLNLLKKNTYSISIDIKDIFEQASSLKPTDCVSAAYKLDLLRRKLPELILKNEQCSAAEPVSYSLVRQLLTRAQDELSVCRRSVVLAARSGPMYGVLHCINRVVADVNPETISEDPLWTALVDDIIRTCMAVNEGVSSVVNNSSPEGHLPMDMTGVVVTDDGNSGGVMLDDGRQVTAQMVLLCAWRSVKEVSLLLGSICSRLSISGEGGPLGTLSAAQLALVGEHLTSLLAETKHRGAFEQAYVGFTKLLARLWRCRNPELHSLPPSWLDELMDAICSGEKEETLCATRRSAGLPFMIQALVTTELQVQSNPRSFHACMCRLLRVARSAPREGARSHALNILRALFRHAALDQSVAPYVGEGLLVALQGFEGDTWAERNSSTLLLSALVTRVFGVPRSRGPGTMSPRNTMTGRIFFLRYPRLYDFMLAKLQQVSSDENKQLLQPSLYPVLLLLARLYPSSLEGTVSNLKLVSFVPWVSACGASAVLKTRELAAAAIVPLISPDSYISHVQSMFGLLRPGLKRNSCHGVLLQLARLLAARPEGLQLEGGEGASLRTCVPSTLWILTTPCYLIATEYVKILNLLAWKFPTLFREEFVPNIIMRLEGTIFQNTPTGPGRDIYLSNAVNLYFILLSKDVENSCKIIMKSLRHSSYEVILSVLNYLLILHKKYDEDKCKLQEHLTIVGNTTILDTLRTNDKYIQTLYRVIDNEYLECKQKSLKLLILEENTQKYIIEANIHREMQISESVIDHLLECLQDVHENLSHMYLESLLNYVTNKIKDNSICFGDILKVIRAIFECSSSGNGVDTRSAVVRFIERNIQLLDWDTTGISDAERFEFKATIWCTIITLLEDDDDSIRQRVTDTVTSYHGVTSRIVASACAEHIRERIRRERDSEAMFILIALLDFRSVVISDDGNDECRVFDQNERYNIFLEETIWSSACADELLKRRPATLRAADWVASVIDEPTYKQTFDRLCNENIALFKRMVRGEIVLKNDALNPKIQLFVNKINK